MTTGSDIRAEVLALFADGYGGALTLSRAQPGTYNPATGETAAAGAPLTIPGKGKVGDYRDGVIDGELIKVNDRRCTFIPDDFVSIPEIGDTFVDPIDSRSYSVVNVRRRQLGLDYIAFTLQVR